MIAYVCIWERDIFIPKWTIHVRDMGYSYQLYQLIKEHIISTLR